MSGELQTNHRHAEIISAAEKVFDEFGYAQATMDTVASRAGLSKGTIYNYFPSKSDLFRAVFAEGISETETEVQNLSCSPLPARDRLGRLLEFWFSRMSDHNRLGRLILEFWANAARQERQGELAQMFQQLYTAHRAMIVSIIDDGVANGEFKVEFGSDVAASLIMGILDGIDIQMILDVGIKVDDQFIAALKRAIMLALSAENGKETHNSPQDG